MSQPGIVQTAMRAGDGVADLAFLKVREDLNETDHDRLEETQLWLGRDPRAVRRQEQPPPGAAVSTRASRAARVLSLRLLALLGVLLGHP